MIAELGWSPPNGDVIDEFANGGLLTVPQAATICEVTDQTIYRWIDDAVSKGQPLGKKRDMVDRHTQHKAFAGRDELRYGGFAPSGPVGWH